MAYVDHINVPLVVIAFNDLQQSQKQLSNDSTHESVDSNDSDTPHGSGGTPLGCSYTPQLQQHHSIPLTKLSQTPEVGNVLYELMALSVGKILSV